MRPAHPRVAWAYELRRDPLGYLSTLACEGALSADSEPRVQGLISRTLFEQGWWSAEETYAQARVSLSAREAPPRCVAWLEGFLTGGGLLLIYHPELRALIDR